MKSNKNVNIWSKIGSKNVFFIAEIGKNFIRTKKEQSRGHYLYNAKQLISQARAAGADAVKFQTHQVGDEQWQIKVVSPHFKGADRYAWVKRNSLLGNEEWWKAIKKYCTEQRILFFSTPMSRGAAKMLNKIGVPLWKVGSGDILDFVLLDYLRTLRQPIIISTGMSSRAEVEAAIKYIKTKNKHLALLHCVSKYPCPVEDLNVATIGWYKARYQIPIGFSDHSLGYQGVIQAVKQGATIIEKHFSLNRRWWGADHKVSMTPNEFTAMTRTVRQGVNMVADNPAIIGQVSEELADSHSGFRGLFRKSLVASRDIKKGEVIKASDLWAMRPQALIKGIGSENYPLVVGKKAVRDIKAGEPLTTDDQRRVSLQEVFYKQS